MMPAAYEIYEWINGKYLPQPRAALVKQDLAGVYYIR